MLLFVLGKFQECFLLADASMSDHSGSLGFDDEIFEDDGEEERGANPHSLRCLPQK